MQSEQKVPVPSARSLMTRRSAAGRTVLLATGVTVFLLTIALSAVVALGIRGPLVSTRATLAAADTADSSVILSAAPASNATAQDVGVRHVIAQTFAGVAVRVTRQRIPASGRTPATITWTITPDARRIEPSQLGQLSRGFARIDARVDASAAARSPGANVAGHGAQTVTEMRIAIAAVDTVLPIPLTVLSLAGIIALLLCARLLTATRENEARLVRARGGSVRTLVLADSSEALARSVVAALGGAVVAQVILFFTLGLPTGVLEIVIAPVSTVVAAVVVSAITGALAARDAHGAPRPSSGRAGVATIVSFAALLVIVSAIATWRFLQSGAPVVGRQQDVAAILAPALLLCTAAILSLILFFPFTGSLQRARARRTTGLMRVFPARTLHRNPRLFAGPIALLVISVATATVAAGYSATWTGFLADSTRLVTGSDVRATFGGDAIASDASTVLDSATYARLPGVTAAIPALNEPSTVSDENITTIGISMDRAASVVGPTSSVLNVDSMVRSLRPRQNPLGGIPLPTGATAVTIQASSSAISGGPASVLTTLWLADSVGDLAPVSFPTQAVTVAASVPGAVSATASIPSAGPWHVVAIDADVSATHLLAGFSYAVESLSARTSSGDRAVALASPKSWKTLGAVFNDGQSSAGTGPGIGFGRTTVRGGTNTAVRMMPPGPKTVPVLVSRALAEANELRVGDHIDVDGQWASFSARVAGVVPLVPGVTSQASLIGDLRSIDNGWLRSSEQVPALHELWIAGSPSAAIARESAAVGTARITVASGSVSQRFVGGAVTGLWLGAAGSAAFAIVTLIASLASIVRRRSREVGVLRALGMSARDQATMRRAEIAVVIGFGLVIGALTGVGMLFLTVGTLARSSTPEAPGVLPLVVKFDFLAPAAVVVGLLIVSIVVVNRYLAVILRAARVAKP